MLKRLLTAVLVLGLILAFSSTAFTDPKDMPGDDSGRKIPIRAANAPELRPAGYTSVNKVALEGYIDTPRPLPPAPVPAGVDTTECHLIGWADWVNATFSVSAPRTSATTSYNELAMRYDGPSLPNTVIRLDGAQHWIRRVMEGGVKDGTVNAYVRVYSDVGGIPTTLLYQELFVLDTHFTSFDNTLFPFTTPVIISGGYFISFSVDLAGPPKDTIVWMSDDAGYNSPPNVGTATVTGRARVRTISDGLWKTLPVATGLARNMNYDQYADFCQVYTKCDYLASPITGVGLYTFPGGISPLSGGRRNGAAQRFVPIGPDTLKSVIIYHYGFGGSYGYAYYGPTSTNGVKVMVFGDDAGNPDYATGPLAEVTLPPGASLFPQTGLNGDGFNYIEVDFSSFNLVLSSPYHLAAQMTSAVPSAGRLIFCLSDEDPASPGYNDQSGASINYNGGTPWENTLTNPDWQAQFGGGELGFLIEAYICNDEFSLCNTAVTYYDVTTGYYGGIPGSGFSRQAWAMKISGTGLPTRVDKFRVLLGDETVFGGTPEDNGTPAVNLTVRAADILGAPGSVLYTEFRTEAEIVYYPGWTEVVIPGGLQIGPGDFFVCVELAPPTTTADYIYFMAEAPAATLYNGGAWQIWNTDLAWHPRTQFGDAVNGVFEVEYCSVPPTRWTCTTPQDFQMAGYDQGRTLHTNVPLSDAYCDLTLRWKYVDPIFNVTTNRINNSGPVVYDTFVICGFASRYRFLNLNDGTVIGEIAGAGAPYYLPSSGINCTPTIAMVTVGSTPKPIMFVGSGSGSGYRVFSAYDLSSWSGAPGAKVPAQLWSVNAGNYAAMGYTFPGPPLVNHLGATNWTNPIVLNIDDVDMVFFNTNDQYVWAANAATGVKIWGPIVIGGLTYKGMATDGEHLFVSNAALTPTYPLGDVSCWDAATGANVWMLSTATGGGLRGAAAMQDFSAESFVSGLAYYGGEIYTVSTSPELEDPTGALGGLFYRIKASTGAVLSITPTEHRRTDNGTVQMGGLMIDAATVVLPGSTRWATSNNGGQLFGYNRFTGGQNWVVSEGAYDADAGHWYDGLLTCEDADSDLGFVTNINGYLSCFNPLDGSEYFSRRFNSAVNVGGALGISDNGDLLVADRNGAIFCLSKNDNAGDPVPDRPRLEIIDHTPQGNTYGPLPEVWVPIYDVYMNSGCAPLTGTITFSTTPNGSTLGPVASSGSGVNRSTSIADQLTESSSKKMLVALDDFMKFRESLDQRPALNRAALATPPFFNTVTLPINLNAGDTGDFVLNLRQSLVYRGENVFYAYFQSNDPDYFLDSTILEPQVRGLIVGGCLLDTTTLHFGTGGVNTQWTLNVPRMGHWGDGADNWYMNIGGDFNDFYGGYYIYGVSKERLAMNTQDWWVGNGEARAYKALQGDPNVCSDNCKPALLADQIVAMITETGASYSALRGNIVCRTYLDSVQMWAPLDSLGNYGAWNWNTTWLTAGTYNNDSTMGLVTHSRSIGFTQFPAAYSYLGKVVVDFMKTFKRYEDKPPVLNWRIGEWIDYDLGGDTIYFWPGISTCAAVGTGTRTAGAWGTIKLPFGGGCNSEVYPAMKNALSLEGNQSMNNTAVRGNAYLDSVYYYMGLNVTSYSQGPMATAPGDQRSHDSWLTHNFTTYLDTLRFAIAHYGDPALVSPRNPASMAAPLAHMLNKLCGMERGDVNNDGFVNLADIVYLADYCYMPTTMQCMDDVGQPGPAATAAHPGPIPFVHIGDVNADDAVNCLDVAYLYDYYFYYGPCPMSKYIAY